LCALLPQLFISEQRKLHNMLVDSDDCVLVVKEQLKETSGIPVDKQDLKWGGKTLDDNKPFKYYGIRAGGFFSLKQK
jgi:Ubiquitin family